MVNIFLMRALQRDLFSSRLAGRFDSGVNVYSRRDLLHQLEVAEADRRSAIEIKDHALVMADR